MSEVDCRCRRLAPARMRDDHAIERAIFYSLRHLG
jgi:hypothetical protein